GRGGDKTAMAAVDELGLIEMVSQRTPDTSVVTGSAVAFVRRHNVPPEKWFFDRGGGGKEHADRLRSQGWPVPTVAFGEAVSPMPRRGTAGFQEIPTSASSARRTSTGGPKCTATCGSCWTRR